MMVEEEAVAAVVMQLGHLLPCRTRTPAAYHVQRRQYPPFQTPHDRIDSTGILHRDSLAQKVSRGRRRTAEARITTMPSHGLVTSTSTLRQRPCRLERYPLSGVARNMGSMVRGIMSDLVVLTRTRTSDLYRSQ